MAAPLTEAAPTLPAAPPPEAPAQGLRLFASGVAVLLHGGLAGLLLLAPATPPGPAAPEVVPMTLALAEPVVEESPAPSPEPAPPEAAAPNPEPVPAAEPPPPEPAPPEPAPPEPVPPEPPPPEPVAPEPPPPEPSPEEPPPPEPEPSPVPAPAPPPPQPQPAPRPRPAPRPPQPRPATTAPAAATAPAAPPARPAAGPPPSYLQALAAALERYKRYPEAARSRRATGVALLQFTVLRDGRVARWRIERSAGDVDLDRAVEAMIQAASLPAMPAGMEGDSLVITVPVRFQVR